MAKIKETTGIVGLDVVPNPREALISVYNKTLEEIQAVPKDEAYRKNVESLTRQRLQVCQEELDCEVIEKRLDCGPIQQVIEDAEDELKIITRLAAVLEQHPMPHSKSYLPEPFTMDDIQDLDAWNMYDSDELEEAGIERDDRVSKDDVPLPNPGPLHEEFYKAIEELASKHESAHGDSKSK
ncbi:unnamed protein product [Amaranthus hypochondriacus]